MTKFRLFFLAGFFILGFSLILFRAFQLQLIPHENVEILARRQLAQKIEVVGRRGSISDRNGVELAVSVNSISIFANPNLIRNPKNTARILSEFTKIPASTLLVRLKSAVEKKLKFVWIYRQLNSEQMHLLENVDLKEIPGIGLLPEYRREYPQNSLASQILGFVNVDAKGLEGLESSQDKLLAGSKNKILIEKDALGRPIYSHRDQIRFDLAQGAPLNLTIDSGLQFTAEKVIKETVEAHKALAGTAIVMNPQNGEILALAAYPFFNLNAATQSTPDQRRNRAITDPIEPGSVVKPFVVAKALEDKIVTPRSILSGGNGFIRIGNKTIGEADAKHRFKEISVSDLIRVSSNVATVHLQQKMGFDRVYDIFKDMGFGELSGIELPGESRGIFKKPSKNQLLEQATYSFGQGFAITPLQIATAYSIIANGGYKIRPTIIKKTNNESLENGKRILSLETTSLLKKILERVVEEEGTGTLAKIEGFKVAGKTGTSQKISPRGGYEKNAYLASFAGMVPSQNPRYVIYVMVDHPSEGGFYGAQIAAPAFAKIAQAAVRLNNFHNRSLEKSSSLIKIASPKKIPLQKIALSTSLNNVPNFMGQSLSQSLRVLQKMGLGMEIEGEGKIIADQLPSPGQALPKNKKIYLKLR